MVRVVDAPAHSHTIFKTKYQGEWERWLCTYDDEQTKGVTVD